MTWSRIDNFGCATPSALASLLLSPSRSLTAQDDANALTTTGVYSLVNGIRPSNFPNAYNGVMIVINNGEYKVSQIILDYNDNNMWFRTIDYSPTPNYKTWQKVAVVS